DLRIASASDHVLTLTGAPEFDPAPRPFWFGSDYRPGDATTGLLRLRRPLHQAGATPWFRRREESSCGTRRDSSDECIRPPHGNPRIRNRPRDKHATHG